MKISKREIENGATVNVFYNEPLSILTGLTTLKAYVIKKVQKGQYTKILS